MSTSDGKPAERGPIGGVDALGRAASQGAPGVVSRAGHGPATRRPRGWWLAIPALFALVLGGLNVVSSSAAAAPRSLWGDTVVPNGTADNEVARVELGTQFRTDVPGRVTAIRYYRFADSIGPSRGTLWDAKGRKLASVRFRTGRVEGWHKARLDKPVRLKVGRTYVVSYTSGGRYAGDQNYFPSGRAHRSGSLTATAGVYRYGSGFPTNTWRGSTYYADVEFVLGGTGTSRPTLPTPTRHSPTPTARRTQTQTPTSNPTPTTTDSPSPSSTATPTTASGCSITPSDCGFPDASTTGPSGSLKRVPQDTTFGKGWHWDSRGWVTVDGQGAVFSGYMVSGAVDVTAKNVTIRRNAIATQGWPVSTRHADGVVIEDNTISGESRSRMCDNGIRDIYGDTDDITISGNEIYDCYSGINHFNMGGQIRGNYIHDIGSVCTGLNPDCGHFNGIQLGAGLGPVMTIADNTVLVPATLTDAIMLANDDGPQTNRTISGNLLAGGGYTLYGSGGQSARATNIVVRDNSFSTVYFPRGGSYGAVAHWQNASGNVWSGNVWVDGPNAGRPVTP